MGEEHHEDHTRSEASSNNFRRFAPPNKIQRFAALILPLSIAVEPRKTTNKVVLMNLVGQSRTSLSADYVVLASSTITPNISSSLNSGLEINSSDGGVVTNDQFEVGNGVYAAGVVASYFDPSLGRRRVNRYDHSVNRYVGVSEARRSEATKSGNEKRRRKTATKSG